jgi:hypothetical protein
MAHGHGHVPHSAGHEMEMPESKHEHLNMRIAVTVALISTFMAGVHIANENTVIEMHHAEVSALDTWNQYQAKRIREYLTMMSRDQMEVLGKSNGKDKSKAFVDQDKKYALDIEHYKTDEADLKGKAKKFEEEHDHHAKAHDRFDISDGSVAVCLSVLAVTALTGKDWLLWVAWAFAGVGVVTGIWGLTSSHLFLG